MGGLGSVVQLTDIPGIMPIFCASIDIMLGEHPKPRELSVLLEASWKPEIAKLEVPLQEIEAAIESKMRETESGVGGVSISIDIKTTSFEIPAEGLLKAWVTWGDDKMLAGGVKFKKQPSVG